MSGFGAYVRGLFGSNAPKAVGQERPRSCRAFDWTSSSAHQNLLAHFLSPKATAADLGSDWEQALGESAATSVERFVALGLLKPMPLDARLDCSQRVSGLQELLKSRGLSVTGRKAELIARLVEADRGGAARLVEQPARFQCTSGGGQLAQQWIANLAEQRAAAVAVSLNLVRERQYQMAFATAQAHRQQLPPDPRQATPFTLVDPDPVGSIVGFADGRPGIFGKLPEETWESLRIAAAMDGLWGGWLSPWMPPGLERIGRFDLSEVYVLLQCNWNYRRSLLRMRAIGIDRGVISCGRDSCPGCQSIANNEVSLDELPELPFAACTTKRGCHCRFRPILNFAEDES